MPTQNVKILFITKPAHSHIDTENQMPNRLPYSIIIRLALTYWTIKCNTITTSKEEKTLVYLLSDQWYLPYSTSIIIRDYSIIG